MIICILYGEWGINLKFSKIFNTIRSKLMLRFVIIIIVTLIIITISLSYLFKDYHFSNQEQNFIEQGERIASLLETSFYEGNYIETFNFLQETKDFFEGNVWIVDSRGMVVVTTQSEELEGVRLNREEVEQVYEGNVISKRGFSEYFEEPTLFTAVPVSFSDEVIGAVFVYSPLSGVSKTLVEMRKLIYYAALIAIVLAFILSFTLSENFSRPLKQMKQIAVNMAHGDFEQRVEIESDDEIAQLARSFNYLADELEEKIHSLKKKERQQRRFVVDVSHELRTPLTSIQGFVKALRDGVYQSEEDKEEYYYIVLDEVKRLIRLVNDLLDLSQIESEQIKLNFEVLNINQLIESTVKNLGPSIRDKNLTITKELTNDLAKIKADKDRIGQVLINLFSNAIDFTPQGEEIVIETKETYEYIIVLIKDSGPGIPEGEKEDIWNRFHKVDKSRTRKDCKSGTGLGLSIAREIIKLHDGEIWVEDAKNQGAIFGFKLKKE